MHSSANILYLHTQKSTQTKTLCQHKNHYYIYPTTPHNVVKYLLEINNKSLTVQLKHAKVMLKINKLVPIYIHDTLILFPLKPKRAPIQYYINAHSISGIKTTGSASIIQFDNSHFLTIDEPYHLILKKWQESIVLIHLFKQTYN